MTDWDCRKNPVYVSRDAGYSKIKSIFPENRKKAKEMKDNGDAISRIDVLTELYSKMRVIVHPERMINWYAFTD